MNQQQFDEYFMGQCDDNAAHRFEQWYMDNIDNPELDRMSLSLLERMSVYHDTDAARDAYNRLCKFAKETGHKIPGNRFFGYHRAFYKFVAAAAVVLVVFGMGWLTSRVAVDEVAEPAAPQLVSIYCPAGCDKEVVLPDSSTIVIRPDSRVVYDRLTFGENRKLYVYGDIYCEVRPTADHQPFDIECQGSTIQVLGTKFDVRSHDNDTEFEVMLYEGSVKLNPRFAEEDCSIVMSPGEIVKVNKVNGNISRTRVDGIGHNTGTDYYIDCTLNDVLAALGRKYDRSITIRGGEEIGHHRIFAIFSEGESIEEAIKTLSTLTDLHVERPDSMHYILM